MYFLSMITVFNSDEQRTILKTVSKQTLDALFTSLFDFIMYLYCSFLFVPRVSLMLLLHGVVNKSGNATTSGWTVKAIPRNATNPLLWKIVSTVGCFKSFL